MNSSTEILILFLILVYDHIFTSVGSSLLGYCFESSDIEMKPTLSLSLSLSLINKFISIIYNGFPVPKII